jgi:hypothetical protein
MCTNLKHTTNYIISTYAHNSIQNKVSREKNIINYVMRQNTKINQL